MNSLSFHNQRIAEVSICKTCYNMAVILSQNFCEATGIWYVCQTEDQSKRLNILTRAPIFAVVSFISDCVTGAPPPETYRMVLVS